jgi:hypothetical protein
VKAILLTPDGDFAADVKCSVTQFQTHKDGQRTIKGQAVMPGTVYCSYSDGWHIFGTREMI